MSISLPRLRHIPAVSLLAIAALFHAPVFAMPSSNATIDVLNSQGERVHQLASGQLLRLHVEGSSRQAYRIQFSQPGALTTQFDLVLKQRGIYLGNIDLVRLGRIMVIDPKTGALFSADRQLAHSFRIPQQGELLMLSLSDVPLTQRSRLKLL